MRRRVSWLMIILVLRMLPGIIGVKRVQNGVEVRITGEIDKIYKKGSECVIKMGRFWLESQEDCRVSRGDKIRVSGRTSIELTDILMGRIWLVDLGKLDLLVEREKSGGEKVVKEDWFDEKRARMVEVYRKMLPEPEASLVAGIVLGEKSSLPSDFYKALVDTGTIHIVVASGYNVMVVGMMILSALLYWFRRPVAVWVAILGMLGYGLVAGGDPPVMRAVVMGGMLMVGQALGRSSKGWWSLLLAGWGMLMIDPFLIESISFQLSMAASLGLLWLDPWLRRRLERKVDGWRQGGVSKVLGWVMGTELVPTLSAQILTGPIIFYHFGRVSLISPLVNLLVLPLVPIIMAWGGLMLALGLIWRPLGMLVSWLVYSLSHLLVEIVRWFG